MAKLTTFVVLAGSALLGLAGCDAPQPEHPVKPLAARPTSNIPTFNTPEDKIRYIQNSNAPDSVKKSAIARLQSGN